MTRAPILAEMERRKKVGDIFYQILSGHGLEDAFDERELQIRDEVIVENTGNKQRLSTAVLDYMFPKQQPPAEFLHYTTPDGLAGIARSGELRLYALRRRIDEEEIRTFARTHGLTGYFDSTAGEPYYKELSDDLFYTSFTRPGTNEVKMWEEFAKAGTGARLKVRLIPAAAELRSIQYEQPSRTLLSQIYGALAKAGEAAFVPWTISKIGAFYLPSSLDVEDEARLLMKRHKTVDLGTANDGKFEYLPVPIGRQNPFCYIEVLGIELGPHADEAALKTAIAGTALAKVPMRAA
jgi:hypothetical protein